MQALIIYKNSIYLLPFKTSQSKTTVQQIQVYDD